MRVNDDDWAWRRPHPALRPFVTRYVGYSQHGLPAGVHRGLPSRSLTLIVSLAGPVGYTAPRSGEFQALVGGLHVAPVLVRQDATQEGVQVGLSPLGARSLLGAPAAALSGEVAGLADLGRPALATLPERLAEAGEWPARFDVLDDVLRAAVVDAPGPSREISRAWRRMFAAEGLVRVSDLAGEVGWSRRHFGERFRAELGLSPKQAARVLRFERSATLLRRHGRVDLATLAADCGFYDQAHLTNEWQALAGCTPGTWIAEELPRLRATAGAGA